MTKATWFGAGTLAVSLVLVAGCGSESSGALDGDCSARIHFRDHTYRGHNATRQSVAAADAALGTGDVVGCDLNPVDHVAVHTIRGVDPRVAITVTDKHWHGVYVREGTRPADWPQIRATTP